MRIAKEALPFIIPLLIITIVIAWRLSYWAIIPFILLLFVVWFFRDPNRVIPTDEKLILSAADGTVDTIEEIPSPDNPQIKVRRVSVFLSIFNVHINRSPVAGEIKTIQYNPGQFLNAMNKQSGLLNENNLVMIQSGTHKFWVRQIAGLIAQRIICKIKLGDKMTQGQKIGMIRFGSRTDVLMPLNTEIQVKIGDRVKGGETVLAKLL